MATTQDPIETLKDSVTSYLSEIYELKKTVEKRDQKIISLETSNAALNSQLADARGRVKSLEDKVTTLNKEIEAKEKTNATLVRDNAELKANVAEQESKILELQKELTSALSDQEKAKKPTKKKSKEKGDSDT